MAFLLVASFLPLIMITTSEPVQAQTNYPVVAAENGGYHATSATEHTVNLPSGIQAEDLLLVFFVSDGTPTITFPEGWTQLFQTADDSAVKFGAWYRIADGGEGATITVTTSASEWTAHTSYRITGYSGTPEVGTPTTGASANPDPPSLTPSWGAKDTLWFAIQGNDSNKTVSDYPADYTDGRNDYGNSIVGCGVGSARRELNATSEDPGTFTLSASEQWIANTVAIQPAAVGEAPEKPVLVSPENQYSTSDNTPTFVWENGANATSHRLVIDNSQGFDDGDNIYDNAGAWDNSGTAIENELPADNYWWRICAVNAQGDNWSENTWTFEITEVVGAPKIIVPRVFASVYTKGESGTVWAQVLDSNGDPVNTATVTLTVWKPDRTKYLDAVSMTFATGSDGIYNYALTAPDVLGTYLCSVKATWNGSTAYGSGEFQVASWAEKIESILDNLLAHRDAVESKVNAIHDNLLYVKDYLTNTIKPQLDAMKENIDKTLDNAVAIHTYLTGTIKPAIDDAYNQAVANYDYLTDTIKPQLDNIQENLSVTADLPENIKENIFATYSFLIENIKPELDNVYENVNASYDYLINTINPKLDEIAAGVGVGLSIEVTRYYQLNIGDLQEFYVTIVKGTNVDWVTMTLEDPKSTLVVDNATMSNPETGIYYYSFQTSGRNTGGWLATIVANEEDLTTTYLGFWRLGGEGEAVGYLTLTVLDNETNEQIEGVKVELYKAGTLVESKYTRWDGKAFLDIMAWDIHELRWSKDGYETETMEIDLAVSSDLTLKMVPTEGKAWAPPITWILGALVVGGILTTSVYYGSKKRAKAASLGTAFILPAILLGISWCAGVVG